MSNGVFPHALLNSHTVEEGTPFDFRGIRLDWFRLQAYSTSNRPGLNLMEKRELPSLINQIIFRTKMVDYLDEMLIETSDLSIFWYEAVASVNVNTYCTLKNFSNKV